MVTLHFRLSDLGTVQIDIDQPVHLEKLLQQYAAGNEIDPGSCIAIRDGKVIGAQTIISDGEKIILFPALSGG